MPSTPAWLSDDLVERIEAAWRILAHCRLLVDGDVADTVTAAMVCLDEVIGLARALPVGQRQSWLADLAEIEEMACTIHAHLLDTIEPEDPDRGGDR